MRKVLLAGCDLGTTGVRSVLFDAEMNVLGEHYVEYPLITGSDGTAEQDAEHWWSLLCLTLERAAAAAGAPASAISALSISSQGITLVPVDAAIRPLANAITWLDQRGQEEGRQLLRDLGEERFREITKRISPQPYGVSKLLWLQKHRPELSARVWKYLMPMDFVIARLTGRAATDYSMAAGLACYDMERFRWSEEILDAVGIGPDMLAELGPSGSVAGRVTPEAAARTGLSPGIPVVIGAQDQKCGGLAAGLNAATATVSMGTCLAVLVKSARAVCDLERNLPCFADIFGEGYLLEGCVNVGAGCLKWFRDTFCPGSDYDSITRIAGGHVPTMETPMFFPHLSGMSTPKRWPGASASLYGLRLGTPPEALPYAVLEAVAFALRQNLDAARDTAGVRVETLRVFGGGARSAEWMRILADVTGLPVERLYTHETCCVGAGMLAGIGSGVFRDWREAQRTAVRVRDAFDPDPSRAALYSDRYRLYNLREDRIYRDAYMEEAAFNEGTEWQ